MTTRSGDARRQAASRAAAVFALVAPMSYAGLRLYEILRAGHVDPSLILLSSHQSYLWRIVIASWWAATVAFVSYGHARSRPLRMTLWARAALLLAALFLLLSFAYP